MTEEQLKQATTAQLVSQCRERLLSARDELQEMGNAANRIGLPTLAEDLSDVADLVAAGQRAMTELNKRSAAAAMAQAHQATANVLAASLAGVEVGSKDTVPRETFDSLYRACLPLLESQSDTYAGGLSNSYRFFVLTCEEAARFHERMSKAKEVYDGK